MGDPDKSRGQYSRRQLVKLAGMAGVTASAGCISTGGDDSGGGDGSSGGGGGGSGGESSTQTKSTEMADSITQWSFGTFPKTFKDLAKQYEEEHGGEINVKGMSHEENNSKFKSALASGTGAPAIGTLESRTFPTYIGTGGLWNVDDRIDSEMREKFLDFKWEAISDQPGYEGTYGLPVDAGPVAVFYKRDVYEEAGINPDDIETYDDWIEAGKQLPDDTYMTNMDPSADGNVFWELHLRQLGGQAYTKDGKLQIDTKETERVGKLAKRFFDEGIANNTAKWSESWFTSLKEGKIATVTSGGWMTGVLKDSLPETEGNWGIHKIPAFESGGGRATNHGGSNLTVPNQISDAKKERAWDFMKFALGKKEMQVRMWEEHGNFPTLKSALEDDVFKQEDPFFGGQSMELLAEVATEIPRFRYLPAHQEVLNRMNTWMARVIDGEVSPSDMPAKAQADIAERTGLDTA